MIDKISGTFTAFLTENPRAMSVYNTTCIVMLSPLILIVCLYDWFLESVILEGIASKDDENDS